MEQMPAAVINGLSPCHVSLHVQGDAAGRSTPLSCTNPYSSGRQPASHRAMLTRRPVFCRSIRSQHVAPARVMQSLRLLPGRGI